MVGRIEYVALGSLAARANLDEGIWLVIAQAGSDLPLEDGLVVDADVGEEARLAELEQDPLLGVGGGGPVGTQVRLQHIGRLLRRRLARRRLHPETQRPDTISPLRRCLPLRFHRAAQRSRPPPAAA